MSTSKEKPAQKPAGSEGGQSETLHARETVLPLFLAVEPEVQLIYLGPNIPGGLLAGNTVFKGGTPGHLEALIKGQPLIRELIVPVGRINEVNAKILQLGTIENQAYQALTRGTGAGNGI